MRFQCDVALWLACVWAAITGVGMGCLIVWVGYGLAYLLMQL